MSLVPDLVLEAFSSITDGRPSVVRGTQLSSLINSAVLIGLRARINDEGGEKWGQNVEGDSIVK